MSYNKQSNLIWIDLEMTGLDTQTDKVIELATVITDCELNVIDVGPELAIFQPESVLRKMDQWNMEQHTGSGLLARVRQSQISEKEAEQQTMDFVRKHVKEHTSPMCGNSICQDRRFLAKHMPMLESYFHYRHLDVSTLKLLVKYWAPNLAMVSKASKHRAKDDVLDSIAELRYYRKKVLSI